MVSEVPSRCEFYRGISPRTPSDTGGLACPGELHETQHIPARVARKLFPAGTLGQAVAIQKRYGSHVGHKGCCKINFKKLNIQNFNFFALRKCSISHEWF